MATLTDPHRYTIDRRPSIGDFNKYVPMLETKRKKKLLILINYHTDAQESIDWLRDTGADIRAEKLGYAEVTAQAAEYSFLLKGDD